LVKQLVVAAAVTCVAASAHAQSYYTTRLDDPKAVHADAMGAKGDGLADDTAALQAAIDRVQETVRQGIVFVPPGRYRITRTLNVWPAIRLVGYGTARPLFVLPDNTPGYADPSAENYLVFFAGARPGSGPGQGGSRQAAPGERPNDANPGTFYSAMTNIDIEVGAGNAGAVAVRGTYAQHCFLAHMEIRVGPGIAGVHDTGNLMEDVRFVGGRYGIWTRTPSPSWQFTAVDVAFEDQREAAIRETAAGLTLIRPTFRRVPTAITIDEGSHDELWVKDGRLEDVTAAAVIVSLEANPRTQVNMENVVCRRVPTFLRLRDSGRTFTAPGEMYEVRTFSHGLHYKDIESAGVTESRFDAAPLASLPPPPPSDLVPLPPGDTWVNIRSLGAKGDGVTDDTAVFRKAIAEHRAIYLPSGYYVISDTLVLRPDTALIGLHPLGTQLDLPDRTSAFQGIGPPRAMIEAPKGGTNVVIGIGLYTNGINPRALGAKWMAGANSMMNDVRLLGGHGTNNLDGSRANPYNNNRTADPDANRRWDSQYPSLWVTDGGGGTFLGLWTPSSFASSGLLVSDTSTEGRVYGMSSEHHVRYEVQLHRVANWKLYSLQTEEERGESGFALPLEIVDSRDITIANFHLYRVISSYQPFRWAVTVTNSTGVRFRNFHCYSNSKVSFDAAIGDRTRAVELRQREFAWLTLSTDAARPPVRPASALLEPGASVERLADGFFNISGGATAPDGDFYFVDARFQRIHRWAARERRLSTVSDAPVEPVNLAFDKAGHLLVVSYAGAGTVYAIKPDAAPGDLAMLQAVDAAPRPGLTAVRAVSDWRLAVDERTGLPASKPHHYIAPDGTTFIPAGADFVSGAMSWGVKSADLIRGFGLAPVAPGQPAYFTSEAEVTTWRMTLGADGNVTKVDRFAEQGAESVAVDAKGNVYVAAGQIYVYAPDGPLLETIETPARPIQIVFGGPDRRFLFITSRDALYGVRMTNPGR
jgi:sugar lactone lactonase YvrE